MVNWEANDRAMKLVSQARHHFVTKFEKYLIDNCPQCRQPTETPIHILKYQSVSAIDIWKTSMRKLNEWLVANKMYPDLKQLILGMLDK